MANNSRPPAALAGAGAALTCLILLGHAGLLIANKPKSPGPKVPSWKERLSDDELLATLPRIATASQQVERQLADGCWRRGLAASPGPGSGAALGMTHQLAW